MILNGRMIEKNENLSDCIDENIEDVVLKVDHKPLSTYKPYTTTAHELHYFERASGDLPIDIKDEKLRELAKEIQNIIKETHES
jgi:uncharacterized metal-binding protein